MRKRPLDWQRELNVAADLLVQVVRRLRRKLAAAGGQGAWIEYIGGPGYAITTSSTG